ncbi:MAG TPA: tRNA (adenosine(37)-N6)-dimethylallyltransferase MiaA [Polyangia bacterium]|jgi:tRNA dimethylallyltransferase|nr:tRNA (adenosine(37)-N6)-dimethylallyltransferase MiaA [Polyangia bacterium]
MASPSRRRFLAVLGPTASGKSALALALARRLGGELVCCDSQQVYIGMDVGTAKPTRDERAEIAHHVLDVVRPDEVFHAARWAALARAAINDVAARGRLPIVVGGTGLYFRALKTGFFEAPPPDPMIRARHRDEAAALGVEALHARLAGVDATAASAIGPRDLVRISRALEIYEQTGVPITSLRREAASPADLEPCALVLDPSLEELRRRIDERARRMFDSGFEDEVRALRAVGYGPALRPLQALGYQQVGALLDGACTRAEALAATIAATVAYARRQRTWFRKEASAARFEAAPPVADLAGTLAAELAS